MKIKKVLSREIFDSRGYPTVECEIILSDGYSVVASVPAGKSRSSYEALDLRDATRLGGRGVAKAVRSIEELIAPILVGQEPNVFVIDEHILQVDTTDDKSIIGANASLAVSIAALRAQSYVEKIHEFELIAGLMGTDSVRLPFPLFNVMHGGLHVQNGLAIQEFMLIPIGAKSFRESMEQATMVYHALGDILHKDGKRILVGDEGGFAPVLNDDREALDYIMRALKQRKMENNFYIALDIEATRFYDPSNGIYTFGTSQLTNTELVAHYKELLSVYPIYSIEDGMAEDDWQGWKHLTQELGSKIQLVADDITGTNFERVVQLIHQNSANAVIIKPNQIGTISETLQVVQLAQLYDYSVVVSHRSGDTEDVFIADLAVGISAGQIKAGGCSRSECVSKYNRLLRIEDLLILDFLDA